MIVEFSVRNFRSIKDVQTISFAATGLKGAHQDIDANNITVEDDTKILKTVGIYGANASGKSNILKAFVFFLQAIKKEPSSESNMGFLCDPFIYNSTSEDSYYQVVLVVNGKKYRYGFTTRKYSPVEENERGSKEIITSEWLYGRKDKNMVCLFKRSMMDIDKENVPNKDKIPNLVYKHSLYLTHAASFDNEGPCFSIRNYLKGYTLSNLNDSYEPFRWNSIMAIESENKKIEFLNLLSSFNLIYNDVTIERDENTINDKIVPHSNIYLSKDFGDTSVKLNLGSQESDGTKKLFDIAGLVIRAFNMHIGGLVIIDEVDSNFHPALLIKLIQLFNNPDVNKSNTQLLFSSHDTNLMDSKIMRRDQFYFAEKNEDNSTRVYSLADLKGIRNDADFAKQYLAGYYGAFPILSKYTNPEND